MDPLLLDLVKEDSLVYKDVATQKWVTMWVCLTSEFLVLFRGSKVRSSFFFFLKRILILFFSQGGSFIGNFKIEECNPL